MMESMNAAAYIRNNPIRLCDYLAMPSPKPLIRLRLRKYLKDWLKDVEEFYRSKGIDASNVDDMLRLLPDLEGEMKDLETWFRQAKGNKDWLNRTILSLQKCKNRAPWTYWEGKAWRGIGRNNADGITLTGDVITDTVSRLYYLVGSMRYKSAYPVQSWTTSVGTASDFARDSREAVQIVLETQIKRNEGFLDPSVTAELGGYERETEVIRVSNQPIVAKVYIVVPRNKIEDALEETSATTAIDIVGDLFPHLPMSVAVAHKIASGNNPIAKAVREKLEKMR
jgi:hypothetical protein